MVPFLAVSRWYLYWYLSDLAPQAKEDWGATETEHGGDKQRWDRAAQLTR